MKVLAHNIKYKGREYGLSVAEISADGKDVAIQPYVREIAGTVFVNGTVEIGIGDDGKLIFCKNCKPLKL